jgi:predicted RNase H-like HicB family nuclease
MQFYKFTILMIPEKEGKEIYYNVSVPALPEITTFGDSIKEARFMAQDALELVVLSRLEEGEAIPADKKPKNLSKNTIVEEIIVTVSHDVKASPASYVKHALAQSA